MQAFTAERTAGIRDEIWFVEHPSVYTLGMRADRAHLLAPGDIPVVQIDRGGQVTYHGPGQLVAYPLVDIKRRHIGVRDLVSRIEEAIIQALAQYGGQGERLAGAPGI